ncbi:rod shape-determining protein MreD [Streptosporangium sandarakinum]|uniref:rod shape-determining protein MreD n=1 Tax=Streptosporangium sandarakinum TaxID=1260955 RepID=UPI0033B6EE69
MGRDALAAGFLLLVMVVQVAVVNRLPLPGDVAPDLVLLTVIGYAQARGAAAGTVMGFFAGLLNDMLPPAAHVMGQYALVLCLVGFAAGRMAEIHPEARIITTLTCAVAGPVLAAAAGALFGDARLGEDMLTVTLPREAVYDVAAALPMAGLARRIAGGPRMRASRPVRYPARSRL